ncbi:MAG: hypothetical protein QXV01_08375, partial [Candidatus Bathyarchaeia archaeon]
MSFDSKHRLVLSGLLSVLLLIFGYFSFFIRSSYCFNTSYYTIKVKEGDWVEYVVSKIFGMAIIPVEFESSFPRVWVSLNESSTFLVEVLEKKVIDFGNYTREFAIFNVSLSGKQLIPFWFFEAIQTAKSLPIDGLTFFLPVNESFWADLKNMVGHWANEVITYGFQVYYEVGKCFYRIRAENLMIGWLEAFANYDAYYGVLTKFSLSFALTQEFVNEINQRIGPLIVNGEPFQIEPGKKYGMEISVNDSNIAQLINSTQFGIEYANLLDKAVRDGRIGAQITVKKTSEGLTSSLKTMVSALDINVNASLARIVIEVKSTVSDGKVLVINIRRDAIPIQWLDEFEVLINGVRVPSADNYEDVLNINEESPEYFILLGPQFTHIAVSIPHFSTVTIEIVKIPSTTARLLLYLGIAGITAT